MSIIGTLPVTLVNGTTADATQVMSLFAWIQSQTNGNACPATTGSIVLKGDGVGGTTAALPGTDYPPINNPIFTGTVTAPAFSGPLTGNVTGNLTGNVSAVTVSASGVITSANGTTGSQVINFSQFTFGTVGGVGSWVKFPNGIIVQVGVGSSSGATYPNASVTWPKPFTSSCFGCVASINMQGVGGTFTVEVASLGTTTGTFVTKIGGNPQAAVVPFNWISMGI